MAQTVHLKNHVSVKRTTPRVAKNQLTARRLVRKAQRSVVKFVSL